MHAERKLEARLASILADLKALVVRAELKSPK